MTPFIDSAAEVAISNLPPQIIALAHRHIQGFLGDTADPSEDAGDWEQATFAPDARYLYDPGYQNGAVPAYVELRVLGSNGPLDPRGYMLISLTEEDFPVIEFATRGETKTDKVVRATEGGTIHKFMRFTPAYIVAEDAAGQRLGALGTPPLTLVGELLPNSQPQVAAYDSEADQRVAPPQLRLNAAVAASYEALKSDFQSNVQRRQVRTLRSRQTTAAWRRSKGIPNPALRLPIAETHDFLLDKSLASVSVEAADADELVQVHVLPTGGFRATGVSAGSVVLRVQEQAGSMDEYTISVIDGQPAIATLSDEKRSVSRSWLAGTGWDGDQRHYWQLKRERWCPLVGCGPTALAMLLGWWDANGVPSAFYRLHKGKGDAHHFRFNFDSLRHSDAPQNASDEDIMVPLYDDLYGLCNVLCNPIGDEGATVPDQMVGAFGEYVNRVAKGQLFPQNEYGEKFVGVVWRSSYILPGLGTDWEGGGKMVAEGIMAGRPGIVGLGSTAFDAHYALAYRYKRVQHYEGSELVGVDRYFGCNMGWGSVHEWHNAENVWFGLTARFWQKTLPMPPSAKAAPATTSLGNRLYVFMKGGDNRIYVNSALDGQAPEGWMEVHGNGTTGLAPAAASLDNRLYVAVRGIDDQRIYINSAENGQPFEGFGFGWSAVPDATTDVAPALAALGNRLYVFAKGIDDKQIYVNSAISRQAFDGFGFGWTAIPGVTTDVSPAAASLGNRIYIFAKGLDNRIYVNSALDGQAPGNWKEVEGNGLTDAAPAAAAVGNRIYVFAKGIDDQRIYVNSALAGQPFTGWKEVEGNGVTDAAPAATALGDRIYVFAKGIDDGRIYINSALAGQPFDGFGFGWTQVQ